jgi:hypothetical protein
MRKLLTAIFVTIVMVTAILGITNPAYERYKMLDFVEGKLTHDYIIFSIYQQNSGYAITNDGKYRIYKRYIGIATKFYEISPLKVAQEINTNSE